MITRPKPLSRLEPEARRRAALAFLGKRVDVDVAYQRDGKISFTVTGVLISVASPAVGTVTDLAIIRRTGTYNDVAVSLATVHAITRSPA